MAGQARLKALTAFRKKHTHKSQPPSEKLSKINTLNTSATVLNLSQKETTCQAMQRNNNSAVSVCVADS